MAKTRLLVVGGVLGRSAWMQARAALVVYRVNIPSGIALNPRKAVIAKINKYKND